MRNNRTKVSRMSFSLLRAKTVKRILVELGVPEEQLLTVGMGQKKTPFRVNDIINGKLDPELAQLNRHVIIINEGSAIINGAWLE